jgi:hypothetical protein
MSFSKRVVLRTSFFKWEFWDCSALSLENAQFPLMDITVVLKLGGYFVFH